MKPGDLTFPDHPAPPNQNQPPNEENHRETSIHSNQTNFFSKFIDSYKINSSLNSITKTEENMANAQPSKKNNRARKSTLSKMSLKKNQSKDATTLNISSPMPVRGVREFHRSFGNTEHPRPSKLNLSMRNPGQFNVQSGTQPKTKGRPGPRNHFFGDSLEIRKVPVLNIEQVQVLPPSLQPKNRGNFSSGNNQRLGLNNINSGTSNSNSMFISQSRENQQMKSRSIPQKWEFILVICGYWVFLLYFVFVNLLL